MKPVSVAAMTAEVAPLVERFTRELAKAMAASINAVREGALAAARAHLEQALAPKPERKPRKKRRAKQAAPAQDRRTAIAQRAKVAAPASTPVQKQERARMRCSKCGAEGFRADGCGRTHNVARMDIDESSSDSEDEPVFAVDSIQTDTRPVILADLNGDRRSRRRNPDVVRAKCTSPKRITRAVLAAGAVGIERELSMLDELRPKTRAECMDGPRPCPWVSCKHHLALDINAETGSIKLNRPDLEVWEMPETCALDVADRGGHTLEQVGVVLNVTRERLRQIELVSLQKLRVESAVEDIGPGEFFERSDAFQEAG